jgi:hypothetical protein
MVASGTVCRTSASASRQEHAAHWYDLKPIQVGSSNKIFDSIARSRNAFPLAEDQGPQMSLIDGRWKEDTRKLMHIATTPVPGLPSMQS